MAKGLGLLGTGLKTKEQAMRGLSKVAEEESRNTILQEQIDAQMKAAELNQASTLTAAGGAIGGYMAAGGKMGSIAGPGGAVIGALAGFLFSKLF
tara:strand:+ start:2638 stop:2922 length:285 start_codon:yes stop_codon:yes gene_type:complete